jgi:outer membrane lipoprotein-sorting protein
MKFLILFLGLMASSVEAVDHNLPDIKRIESYLNSLKNFKANLTQLNSDGSEFKGKLMISRPGKLRLDYADPVPLQLISNGTQLIQHDRELNTTAYLDVESTPAYFIVQENLSFGKDVQVVAFSNQNQVMRLTLAKGDDTQGTMMMVFSDKPLKLVQWKVTDPEGRETWVNLNDLQSGVTFNPQQFEFIK